MFQISHTDVHGFSGMEISCYKVYFYLKKLGTDGIRTAAKSGTGHTNEDTRKAHQGVTKLNISK
jgi:hypothetical protein